MVSASSVIAFVESGHAFDGLKQLMQQTCQELKCVLPVLPLEYEGVRYRLQRAAAEGKLGYPVSAADAAYPPSRTCF